MSSLANDTSAYLVRHILNCFQEFKLAMRKLRKAYYENATTVDDIMRENIAYTSDINTRYKVLQAAIYQAIANNKGTDESQHKNTYLIK